MISIADCALLAGAGVLAGTIGTAGGITSLVSYPALLAIGLTPLGASVTNIVALVVCLPGSALSSRGELSGQSRFLRRWTSIVVVGGAAGAALLLATPPGVFTRVVPFLLVLASASLLAQPRLAASSERRGREDGRVLLPLGLFSLSLYNGYFGAGSGVMTLTLMLFRVDGRLVRANALKNILVGIASVVSALAFIAFGHVDWPAAGALAPGLFLGSIIGPALARRIPTAALQLFAALSGIGLAIWLWASSASP